MKPNLLIATALVFAIPLFANAANGPGAFHYEGRITDANGSPVLNPSMAFSLKITSPDGLCALRSEVLTLDLSQSDGYFSISVGNNPTDSLDAGNSLLSVFANGTTAINGRTATNGVCNYTPNAGDGRKLRVSVNDGSTNTVMTPDVPISAAAYAMVADTLQGKAPTDFLQTNTSSGRVLNQTNLESLFATSAAFTELTNLVTGTSTRYARSQTTSGLTVPNYAGATPPSTPVSGSVWFDTSSGTLKYYNGSSSQTVMTAGSAGAGIAVPTMSTSPASPTAGSFWFDTVTHELRFNDGSANRSVMTNGSSINGVVNSSNNMPSTMHSLIANYSPTADPNGTTYGASTQLMLSPSGPMANSEAVGHQITSQMQSAQTVSSLVGARVIAQNLGGGVVNSVGLDVRAINSAGTTNTAAGLRISVTTPTGTVNQAYGVHIGTVQGSDAYGIYQISPSIKNFFAGAVGIGTTTPAGGLDVNTSGSGPVRIGSTVPTNEGSPINNITMATFNVACPTATLAVGQTVLCGGSVSYSVPVSPEKTFVQCQSLSPVKLVGTGIISGGTLYLSMTALLAGNPNAMQSFTCKITSFM